MKKLSFVENIRPLVV